MKTFKHHINDLKSAEDNEMLKESVTRKEWRTIAQMVADSDKPSNNIEDIGRKHEDGQTFHEFKVGQSIFQIKSVS